MISFLEPRCYLEEKLWGKGEKERYTHLNVEFQRIARRVKKAFLGEGEVARINRRTV